MSPSVATRHRIRDLNDAFRTAGPSRGQWVTTRGIADLGPDFLLLAMRAVRDFDSFDRDNDPYGERDFGSLNVGGQHLFWKIDYYDPTMSYGSEDPAVPALTCRVLTIMLASEY